MRVSRARQPAEATHVGIIVCGVVGILFGGLALSVDVPKASQGFKSDVATYYSLAHSLASDLDFQFDRWDLMRVAEEYPTGPEGIFLKLGKTVTLDFDTRLPFVHWSTGDDPRTDRVYYGKSYIYPLVAAPFVWLFGTNGFLVLHALLLVLNVAAAYAFLVARAPPAAAASYAVVFFLASAAPVYLVYLTPDFFNLSVALYGLFLWSYKEVVPARAATAQEGGRLTRLLRSPSSDYLAAVLLGVVTFSKPLYLTLIFPVLAQTAARRQWRRGLLVGVTFVVVAGGLFLVNGAITGELNYQGGDRKTFYAGTGFPFQTPEATFETTGLDRATNEISVEGFSDPEAFWNVLAHNLVSFTLGRHTGLVPYFFPGVLSVLLFLLAGRGRQPWQWLVGATFAVSVLALLVYLPTSYSGGGGPVGNRYFMGFYPLLLFLTPPLTSAASALAAAAVGGLFTAQLVLNPFAAMAHPEEHPKRGPYRLLPVELALLDDLPANLTSLRVRQALGGDPPLLAYLLDDNVYNVDDGAFWIKGKSRADIIVRARSRLREDGTEEPLRVKRLDLEIRTNHVGNRVTVETGSDKVEVTLGRYARQLVSVEMPRGFPYRPAGSTNYVYMMSISCTRGFVPFFTSGGRDNRFLGALIKITPVYEP